MEQKIRTAPADPGPHIGSMRDIKAWYQPAGPGVAVPVWPRVVEISLTMTMMSLGTKLTGYLLLGVLVVMGLELYLSVKRIQTDLLHDVRREVAAISRTLHLAVTLIDRTDSPGPYFTSFVASLRDFENVLDVVFYDHTAQIVARSTTLQEYQLPEVNIQQVMTTQTPAEGLFRSGRVQRYYRVEPIITREGIA